MKFFITLVPDPSSTATQAPSDEFMAMMGEYVTRQISSGKVIATGAMEPIQAGTVVAPVAREARIVDGPYTEAKELVAGWVLLTPNRARMRSESEEFVQMHIDHWPGWNGHGIVREVSMTGRNGAGRTAGDDTHGDRGGLANRVARLIAGLTRVTATSARPRISPRMRLSRRSSSGHAMAFRPIPVPG